MRVMPVELLPFWQGYLATVADPAAHNERFYEAFQIGDSPAAADEGARLIRQGSKTATSSLLWEYEGPGQAPPEVGSLSILLAGRRQPVCVVETIRLVAQPFNQVDAAFAHDYGEWDRSLSSWWRHNWPYYDRLARHLGREASETMPLLCEWFKVVYTPPQ